MSEARAQLTVEMLSSPPFDMTLSSCGTVLASTGGGGWKGRDPFLHYYVLDDQSTDYLEGVTMDPGLSNVAHHIATDESRKLIFLADEWPLHTALFTPTPTLQGLSSRISIKYFLVDLQISSTYRVTVSLIPAMRVQP